MRTLAILNPRAGGGKVERHQVRIGEILSETVGEFAVRHTEAPGHASTLAREAILAGVERIVAVGGDGTVHEVVNGFFGPQGEPIGVGTVLAVLPTGTGGDFARSIGLGGFRLGSPHTLGTERTIDVGCIWVGGTGARGPQHFINIASAGSSGWIMRQVNASPSWLGAKGTYIWGTVRGLATYINQRVEIVVDGVGVGDAPVSTIAVANGAYFGGGMKIAPDAKLDDGMLSVVVVGDIGVGEFIRHSPQLYRGTHTTLPFISCYRGRRVELRPLGARPIDLEADGEVVGCLPAVFELKPKAIRVVAPWL